MGWPEVEALQWSEKWIMDGVSRPCLGKTVLRAWAAASSAARVLWARASAARAGSEAEHVSSAFEKWETTDLTPGETGPVVA